MTFQVAHLLCNETLMPTPKTLSAQNKFNNKNATQKKRTFTREFSIFFSHNFFHKLVEVQSNEMEEILNYLDLCQEQAAIAQHVQIQKIIAVKTCVSVEGYAVASSPFTMKLAPSVPATFGTEHFKNERKMIGNIEQSNSIWRFNLIIMKLCGMNNSSAILFM